MSRSVPSSVVFHILQAGDVRRLYECPPDKLRPFLPYLVRMALTPTSFSPDSQKSERCVQDRKLVLSLIAGDDDYIAPPSYEVRSS